MEGGSAAYQATSASDASEDGCPTDGGTPEPAEKETTTVIATVLVRSQTGMEISEPVRAICDTGAQMSVMTIGCAKRLRLQLRNCTHRVFGIGGADSIRRRTTTHIVPWFTTDVTASVAFLIVNELEGTFPVCQLETKSIPAGAIMADPDLDKPAPIEMLLGVEF